VGFEVFKQAQRLKYIYVDGVVSLYITSAISLYWNFILKRKRWQKAIHDLRELKFPSFIGGKLADRGVYDRACYRTLF